MKNPKILVATIIILKFVMFGGLPGLLKIFMI